jgi:hypothetical protein
MFEIKEVQQEGNEVGTQVIDKIYNEKYKQFTNGPNLLYRPTLYLLDQRKQDIK